MPDLVAGLPAAEGLIWLAAAAVLSGLVRGFAGFGTGMVYLPVAGQILPPLEAILTLSIMDLVGPVPNLPRAWRDADRRDLGRLLLGMLPALLLGLALLIRLEPQMFRYGVSLLTLGLLVLLVAGIRYRGLVPPPLVTGAGALGGFTGGLAGLPGPPVILLYMARTLPAEVIRANILIYLMLYDVALVAITGARGWYGPTVLALGALMILPNLAGNVLGGWLFRPGHERLYRWVAYVLIAASALSGLPVWD